MGICQAASSIAALSRSRNSNLDASIEKKAQCARLDILALYVAPNSI
jgi:hypothetical protein